MAKTSAYNQACPIARTLDLIGDRWTLLIIRDLFLGRSRFGEFRNSTPRISSKLLSQRLRRLEDAAVVERVVTEDYPPRSEYRLTEKGRSLFPVLFAIGSWGFEHLFTGEPGLREEIDRHLRRQVPEYVTLAEEAAARAKEGAK